MKLLESFKILRFSRLRFADVNEVIQLFTAGRISSYTEWLVIPFLLALTAGALGGLIADAARQDLKIYLSQMENPARFSSLDALPISFCGLLGGALLGSLISWINPGLPITWSVVAGILGGGFAIWLAPFTTSDPDIATDSGHAMSTAAVDLED